ncbi:MAG: glycosyltransferase family 4 protein [Gemmataceae bacterium]
MRVAHFVQRYPPALGGSEAYFGRLGRYLAQAGDRLTVHTTTALDLEAFWSPRGKCLSPGRNIEDGVEVRRHALLRFPGQRRILKLLAFLPNRSWQCLTQSCNPIAPTMWQEAAWGDQHFDIVHASSFPYGYPLVCGRRLAKRLNVPFVVTPFLHLGDPDAPHDKTRRAYLSPALLSLLRNSDCVFVQTGVERVALLDLGFAKDRILLQGMGVDRISCTGGDRNTTRLGWGIGPDEVLIGHLANNSVEKGTVDLLRAARRAWQGGATFRVLLAGPEMPNFRVFWRSFPFTDRVRRLGVLDSQQKKDFFAAIDMFAMPSFSDSFGLVFLEAWANGIPNVAYRAGGVAGVIRHEVDGLLVRCGDLNGLAQALNHMAKDKALREQYGRRGQARLDKEFRWEDKLNLVRETYRRLIG